MKKALIIVAAVAGYSLLVTGLFLITLLTRFWALFPITSQTAGTDQAVVGWVQFLLIPGLAALLSRIMYGSYHWGRRTLAIFAVIPVTILTLIVLFAPVAIFLKWLSRRISWDSQIINVLGTILLLLAASGFALCMFLALRRAGKWGVHLEARRWLAEREAGTTPREIKWHNRGIRIASCIPLVIVLLVFLFLPETWGVLSHLNQPRAGNLPGYRVPIPVTWIILFHDEQKDGQSSVNGMAGRGTDLDIKSYIPTHASLSSWEIGTGRYNQATKPAADTWISKNAEVLGRHVFTIGSESITCLEYWPAESHYSLHYLPPRPEHIEDSSVAYIKCSSSGRLHASLAGERSHVPAFYKMISGVTPVK